MWALPFYIQVRFLSLLFFLVVSLFVDLKGIYICKYHFYVSF